MKSLTIAILFLALAFAIPATVSAQCSAETCGPVRSIIRVQPIRSVIRSAPVRRSAGRVVVMWRGR